MRRNFVKKRENFSNSGEKSRISRVQEVLFQLYPHHLGKLKEPCWAPTSVCSQHDESERSKPELLHALFLDIRAMLAKKSLTWIKETWVSRLVYTTELETCASAG